MTGSKKSWRTSVGAAGALLMAIGVAVSQFAGTVDHAGATIAPEAQVEEAPVAERAQWINWPLVISSIGGALTAFGLLNARDDQVSSEGTTASKDRR